MDELQYRINLDIIIEKHLRGRPDCMRFMLNEIMKDIILPLYDENKKLKGGRE